MYDIIVKLIVVDVAYSVNRGVYVVIYDMFNVVFVVCVIVYVMRYDNLLFVYVFKIDFVGVLVVYFYGNCVFVLNMFVVVILLD